MTNLLFARYLIPSYPAKIGSFPTTPFRWLRLRLAAYSVPLLPSLFSYGIFKYSTGALLTGAAFGFLLTRGTKPTESQDYKRDSPDDR